MAALCPNCGSDNTVNNGTNSAGTPRVYCKDCKKTRAISGRKPGGQPVENPLSNAQRQANWRFRQKKKD